MYLELKFFCDCYKLHDIVITVTVNEISVFDNRINIEGSIQLLKYKMTWSKVCSWNEYRNPWKFNDRMYMYIYYLLLLELLYIIYLTWTKHNLKIVIQGRTNLLLVLKNECVTMRESLIICKEYCLWQDLNFESQRYWEGCQENKHSVICDFRHHVSFIVI